MPVIQQLPENLINQIAAGEVVQRPASVVKELLENSLDAGCKRLIIEVKGSGEEYIRLTDDGCGMSKEDAMLCLERHATSKIFTADDLLNIQTFGFRGEAIASIASVARVTIQTKEKGASAGTVVSVEGGDMRDVAEVGCPEGTQITVTDLFYNTPARKKYLKNEATEFGHVLDAVTGCALAHPEVSFKFMRSGKVVLDLAATEDVLVRVRGVLGRDIAQELVPVFYGGSDIQLSGFIGKPVAARSSRANQFLFVNKRPVKSHVLAYAVKQAFHSLLPKERHPAFLLFLSVRADAVDVNVHPQKQEVKFSHDREIFQIILGACKKALETHVLAPKISVEQTFFGERFAQGREHKRLDEPVTDLKAQEVNSGQAGLLGGAGSDAFQLSVTVPRIQGEEPSGEQRRAAENAGGYESSGNSGNQNGLLEPKNEGQSVPGHTEVQQKDQNGKSVRSHMQTPYNLYNVNFGEDEGERTVHAAQRSSESELTPLVQMNASYILCQQRLANGLQRQGTNGSRGIVDHGDVSAEGKHVGNSEVSLVIVDQHAAHERIRYTEIMEEFEARRVAVQKLLLPVQVELTHKEVAFFEENRELFEQMGFEIEAFGGNTFSVHAVPSYLAKEDVQTVLMGLLDDLQSGGSKGDIQARKEKALVYSACRSAVKFGDELPREKLEYICKRLMEMELPYTCPHGRPTMMVISADDLKKRFGRDYRG